MVAPERRDCCWRSTPSAGAAAWFPRRHSTLITCCRRDPAPLYRLPCALLPVVLLQFPFSKIYASCNWSVGGSRVSQGDTQLGLFPRAVEDETQHFGLLFQRTPSEVMWGGTSETRVIYSPKFLLSALLLCCDRETPAAESRFQTAGSEDDVTPETLTH